MIPSPRHVAVVRILAGIAAATAVTALGACSDDSADPLEVTVRVVDESDAPIAGATLQLPLDDASHTTGRDGTARVTLTHGPSYAIVSAPSHLDEPLPLGWDDAGATVTVRLLDDKGGHRIAIHSAGDIMFGRRFETPTEGAPLIPRASAAAGARDVVARIAPLFRAADLRTVNLETVVSDRDLAAYPGKRFILQSRPAALAALDDLGVDVAVLANNHQRDLLDDGVADTLKALDAAKLPWLGASASTAPARDVFTHLVHQTRVAVLAWTTIDGDFVNDSYPVDGAAIPPDVADDDRWQYEPRRWSHSGSGLDVTSGDCRIGSAWKLFADAEPMSSPEPWASISRVYPELQDWVQRRGHGGAAPWTDASPDRIAAARKDADLVIVQIHGGFQFQEASSVNIRAIARRAIDAGADLVVCHHPHVLQGLEWYRGKLIAYSLGNFVFDQDFLSTFASAILRTVWEDGTLVEARLLPVEIDGYRPALAVDAAARRTLLTLWERSTLALTTDRDGAAIVPSPLERDAQSAIPGFVLEHHTARITPSFTAPSPVHLSVPAHTAVALPADTLVDPRIAGAFSIGRDLLGWGALDDALADADPAVAAHWYDLTHDYKQPVTDSRGHAHLRLQRLSTSDTAVLARPVARIPLPAHRGFSGPGAPLDPVPTYSIRLRARTTGEARAHLRVDLYHFDDTDPTEDPTSVQLGTVDLPLAAGADWQPFDLPVDVAATPTANMVLVYAVLDPPSRAKASLDVDDLAFVEWRPTSSVLASPGRYDLLRNDGASLAAPTVQASALR